MTTVSSYDKRPHVLISSQDSDCFLGWSEVVSAVLNSISRTGARRIAIECYPGVLREPLFENLVEALKPGLQIDAESAFLSPAELREKFAETLTTDPVFARMAPWELADYFAPKLLRAAQSRIQDHADVCVLCIGTGASIVMPQADLLVYVDVARWEIQQRQRRKLVANLGLDNLQDSPSALYKRAYFLDWRVADRLKDRLYASVDLWIDSNLPEDPRALTGATLRAALWATAHRPFRVVPFFDPGPWGGQWMRRQLALPEGPSNYAWGFDCVPEENSLILRFGSRDFELPALTLVHSEPLALLGDLVHQRFGAEFPIRFDFLDTMEGGNLSLQVHPLKEYISEHFGIEYTQDESYYMLDAGSCAHVYLGLREGIDRHAMEAQLRSAQQGGPPFPADEYINKWPAARHQHFLIPAGTVHCSGSDSVVLEISATPYIFTFKLWDWGRLGLDGRPRPIHLEHGLKNIQWDRTTEWVRSNLIDQQRPVSSGDGWYEESTGLHELEFLETRRHWFTGQVPHATKGNLNVLNLVQGEEVVVESPTSAFPPLAIHYAETFIVPASVGEYTIRPLRANDVEHATIKAYVRR